MQIYFNSNPLHELGDVFLTGESSTAQPAENPIEYAVRLSIRIASIADTPDYHGIRGRIEAAKEWLAPARGTLRIVNEAVTDGAETYTDRIVRVVSHDLPENPNSSGVYRQEINISFEWIEPITEDSDAMDISFTRTGGSEITLGDVTGWKEQRTAERYSTFHSERKQTVGKISCKGKYRSTVTSTVANRRVELFALKEQWMRELTNGKDGLLKYGTAFNGATGRTVRVDEFTADVNQAVDSIEWTLSCTYTLFPNETAFALVEFDTKITSDNETGEETLAFTGKIIAASYEIAIAKLGLLRTSVLATTDPVFTSATLIKTDTSTKNISVGPKDNAVISTGATINDTVNADQAPSGYTFIELSFSEDYRKKKEVVDSWNVTATTSEDITSGLNTVTYSGTVIASVTGGSYAGAYTAALTKANELGRVVGSTVITTITPYQFLQRAEYSAKYRKPDNTVNPEFVELTFSFQYQTKGSRYRYEVQCERNTDYLGEITDQVSGTIVAGTKAIAETVYNEHIMRAFGWYGSPLRNERSSYGTAGIQTLANIATTTHEVTNGVYTNQFTKLDFSFTVVIARPSARLATMRYEINVSNDYTSPIQTTISGVINHNSYDDAYLYLTNQITTWEAAHGTLKSRQLSSTAELLLSAGVTPAVTTTVLGQAYQFSVTLEKEQDDDTKILECDLSEEITYPNIRYVAQAIPDAVSVVQNCGITDGSRTIRGTVKAVTEESADRWMWRVRDLAWFGSNATQVQAYNQPAQISTSWEYTPRKFDFDTVTPLARNASISLCVRTFSFTQLFTSATLYKDVKDA